MSTRIVAMLAIVGGLCLTIVMGAVAVTVLANPDARPWDFSIDLPSGWLIADIGVAGFVAVSVSFGWLGLDILSRLESPIGLVAVFGAPAGLAGMAGAYDALNVLPLTSAVVFLYLARIQAVRWPLALIHAASAPGLVLILNAYSNHTLLSIGTILTLVYFMTWIGIGLGLLGGLPQTRPAAPSAS
jgi:hypothetical protein